MKSCPSCNLKYADDTLQFCLSDSTELVVFATESEEPLTVFSSQTKTAERSWVDNTNLVGNSQDLGNWGEQSETVLQANTSPNSKTNAQSEETADNKLYEQVLTFAPVTIALMQNYWQWLYMDRPNAFEFPQFLWSINFLVWLALLAGGGWLCFQAIQKDKGKGYAIIGAEVLAINLLLTFVPRRF